MKNIYKDEIPDKTIRILIIAKNSFQVYDTNEQKVREAMERWKKGVEENMWQNRSKM